MILITGGTGLVGAHLLYKLTKSGQSVVALRRKSSDLQKTKKIFSYYSDDFQQLFNMIQWREADLLDYQELLNSFKGVDHIYHCAASVSFQSSDKNTLIRTNIEGTTNIVNAALESNTKKLVHVSSIGALGRATAQSVVDETSPWNDKKTSIYSKSKYLSELEVWRGIAEGLNAVIINPSIILGPGDWESGSSKLFTTMHQGLKFYSTGSNGFVDVEDVADIMIQLMESDISGERYVVSSENIFYEQLFAWMAKDLNMNAPKYKANKFLSAIAWRLLYIKSLFTGKTSTITKETADTAAQTYAYSNKKITETLSFEFLKIRESISKNAKFFLSDII